MNNRVFESSLFQDRILNALEPAIGKRLLQVFYCCFDQEEEIYDPNFYFGIEIQLIFEIDYFLWVTWDSDKKWRSHYTVSVLNQSSYKDGALVNLNANSVNIWESIIQERLQGFDILGSENGPEIIRLRFNTNSVLVGIGYQGSFTDGDDVFARSDISNHLEKQEIIWSSE